MRTVYATSPAPVYHGDRMCAQLISGRELNDWDCDCSDYCSHRGRRPHPLLSMNIEQALADGKMPCYYCVAPRARLFPRAKETFGHEPVPGSRGLICATCRVRHDYVITNANQAPKRFTANRMVRWPCTSALVYGLAPRPGASMSMEAP
jgi:hypothetical protein